MGVRKNRTDLYRCSGENFGYPVRMGCCGDIMTLADWLETLLPNKNATEYFAGVGNETIVEYIYKNLGKRLVKTRD